MYEVTFSSAGFNSELIHKTRKVSSLNITKKTKETIENCLGSQIQNIKIRIGDRQELTHCASLSSDHNYSWSSPPHCSDRCAPYQVAGFGPDNTTMFSVWGSIRLVIKLIILKISKHFVIQEEYTLIQSRTNRPPSLPFAQSWCQDVYMLADMPLTSERLLHSSAESLH